MTKKTKPSSGSSYSLLALLKRMLFMHETAGLDELVEEVHEYMLKDQSLAQIKQRYVEPILRGNPSFLEAPPGSNHWKLTEGNQVNDTIYEIFQKYQTPLSDRQILNRLAKEEHLAKIDVTLDLKNDARFSDLDGGKYWMLSKWIVINDYARSILLKLKSGLAEKELIAKVVEEYKLDPESVVFIPLMDERFVKKDQKWTLRRFVEQKTKLRLSRIERVYQYLQKAGFPLTSDELTTAALNLPAATTDVEEKLLADPRFVRVHDKWDLRARLAKPAIPPVSPHVEPVPMHPAEAVTPAPVVELKAEPVLPEPEQPAAPLLEEPALETPAPVMEELPAEPPEAAPEAAEAEERPAPREPVGEAEKLAAALPQPEEVEPPAEPVSAVAPQLPIEPAPAGEPPKPEETVDKKLERLRKKVVDFLQYAFHAERIVYSADIIDELTLDEYRAELFEQFSLEHFANPAKNRELTDLDLIKFMVYLAEPSLNDKIIDPCCGTGGFLMQLLKTFRANLQDAAWMEKELALQYDLRNGQFYFTQLTQEERQTLMFPLDEAFVRRLPIERFCKQRQLTGVDSEPYAYKTAELNIALHDFPDIVLHQDNALTSKQIGSGLYDLVIGNPPTTEDYPTRFLRRSLVLAKPGGKILLLLPENMFNEFRLVSASLRNQIAAQTIVKAVIEFPEPYNEKAYGPRRILFYCIKKHLDAEQQSDVFVGKFPDFDGLREVLEVLEDPSAPVSQSDLPIAPELILFILASYQGSAYNLFLEGLRRQVLEGALLSVEDWLRVAKSEQTEDTEDAESAEQTPVE